MREATSEKEENCLRYDGSGQVTNLQILRPNQIFECELQSNDRNWCVRQLTCTGSRPGHCTHPDQTLISDVPVQRWDYRGEDRILGQRLKIQCHSGQPLSADRILFGLNR